MFKKMEMDGSHGIKGTPHNSGFRTCGTMQWKICNIEIAIAAVTQSMKALSFPGGMNCQIKEKMMEVRENEHRNDNVGRGLVVPTTT